MALNRNTYQLPEYKISVLLMIPAHKQNITKVNDVMSCVSAQQHALKGCEQHL